MEQALVCLTSLVLLPSRDVPLNGFYDYNIIYIYYIIVIEMEAVKSKRSYK